VAGCGTRGDLNYLIGEMISELNIGHTYIFGGDFEDGAERVGTGTLGAVFAAEDGSDYYRIAEILPGVSWDPRYRSPLAEPGVIAQGLKWLFDPESPFYIQFRLDRPLLSWLWKFRRACTEVHVRRSMPLLRDLSLESVRLFEELDAHPDLYPEYDGDRWSHACVAARLLELEHVASVTQIGIRTLNHPQAEVARRHPGRLAIVEAGAERERLGAVHRDIGSAQQFVAVGAVLREDGHADARADPQAGPVHLEGLSERVAERARACQRLALRLHVPQHNRELVSAEAAGQRAARAHRSDKAPREGGQQAVAGVVTERVVDLLEPVQVDEQKGHPPAQTSVAAPV